MKIDNIRIQNEGYVYCKSSFYSAQDSLSHDLTFDFFQGVNNLIGEIDSGIWAVSYMLSMYKHKPEDFILFKQPQIIVNDSVISLDAWAEFSCYMDKFYPLFSTQIPVKKLALEGLSKSKLNYSLNDIQDLFHIDGERFGRPLTGVGNEIFRAMAAIGYCHGKEVFCWPWLSEKRFTYYHTNLTDVLDILERLNKTVILPTGSQNNTGDGSLC